jgi:hypothetical protein
MRGSVESLSFETISSDAKSSVRCKSGAISRLSAVRFILVDRRRMVNGRCATVRKKSVALTSSFGTMKGDIEEFASKRTACRIRSG